MIQRKQMLQSFVNALGIVDANVGAVRTGLAGVHENGGDISTGQLGHQRGIALRRS